VARPLLGLLAAFLPARHWPGWDGPLPVRAMALPAALVTFFAGFAVGIPGFLRYAQQMGTQVGDLVLQSGHAVNAGRLPADAPVYAWNTMFLALPAYAFLTPGGLLATYLVCSGIVRCACWAAGDPRGDPLLSALDATVDRQLHAARGRRLEAERAAQEGPEVPDLLVTGRAIGVSGAAFAVIASRLKEGWEPGVFVLTGEGRFRLAPRLDRRFPDGLRAVYPLLEVPAVEATRRRVAYTLPPLSDWDPVARQVRPADGQGAARI
jgi:hypothetical protein